MHEETGSCVISPIHYVLVFHFCISNYPDLGVLTQHMFIISPFQRAGSQSGLAGSS